MRSGAHVAIEDERDSGALLDLEEVLRALGVAKPKKDGKKGGGNGDSS
jgi:hypothetical protein